MHVEVEEISPSVKKLKIEVPAETLMRELDSAYRKLNQQVRIDGFRKGKIPRKILERYYSESVKNDVLQKLIPDSYTKIVEDQQIKAVGSPRIDDIEMETNKPLKFTATVDVIPLMTIGDYEGLEFTKSRKNVKEEDVDQEIHQLQERHAQYETDEEGVVEEHDYVIIDFQEITEGTSLTGNKEERVPLVVGSNTLLPDFERQLIGMKKGEEKEIHVTFSPDHENRQLAGKPVSFHVKMHELKKRRLLALDDEFARQLGEYDDLQSLRRSLRETLEQREEQQAKNQLNRQIVEKLTEMFPFEIPRSLIEQEIDLMLHTMEHQFLNQGIQLRDSRVDLERLREGFRESATFQVKSDLLMGHIAENEGVTVEEEELNKELEQLASQTKQNMQHLKKTMQENGSLERLRDRLIREKAFEKLLGKFKISEVLVES